MLFILILRLFLGYKVVALTREIRGGDVLKSNEDRERLKNVISSLKGSEDLKDLTSLQNEIKKLYDDANLGLYDYDLRAGYNNTVLHLHHCHDTATSCDIEKIKRNWLAIITKYS